MNKKILVASALLAIIALSNIQNVESRPHFKKHLKKIARITKHCVSLDKENLCVATRGMCRWAKAAYTGDVSKCVYGAGDLLSSNTLEFDENESFDSSELFNEDALEKAIQEQSLLEQEADEEKKPKKPFPKFPRKYTRPAKPETEESGQEKPKPRPRPHRRPAKKDEEKKGDGLTLAAEEDAPRHQTGRRPTPRPSPVPSFLGEEKKERPHTGRRPTPRPSPVPSVLGEEDAPRHQTGRRPTPRPSPVPSFLGEEKKERPHTGRRPTPRKPLIEEVEVDLE